MKWALKTIPTYAVQNALEKGLAKIIYNDQGCSGIACAFGDHWFYFAGAEGDEVSSLEEYMSSHTTAEIAEYVASTLNSCMQDCSDESEAAKWRYYDGLLLTFGCYGDEGAMHKFIEAARKGQGSRWISAYGWKLSKARLIEIIAAYDHAIYEEVNCYDSGLAQQTYAVIADDLQENALE